MKKSFAIILFALFSFSMIFAVNKNAGADKKTKLVVTGYVISKGNMPFVEAAIKTLDGQEYILVCSQETHKKLLKAQGRKIKFTGYLAKDGQFFTLKKWKKVK